MKTIIVFSNYPIGELQKDGMFQRVKAIDTELTDAHRIYLSVSQTKFWKKSYYKISDDVELYRFNIFVHFFHVMRFIRNNKYFYIHSVHNFVSVCLFSFKHKILTLDLHGVVPQENLFLSPTFKGKIWSKIYACAERKAFKKCSNFIYVSEEMMKFYKSLYPFAKDKKHIVKPIYPKNVFKVSDNAYDSKLKRELGILTDDTVFIYSGNTQRWQNVDLMIDFINKRSTRNSFFIILTGEKEKFKFMLEEKIVNKDVRYCLASVKPEELNSYYSISNYGFIIRDEHILNKVAAPTKLTEYLYYGIIPIVKYEQLGDAYLYNYEHVKYDDNDYIFTSRKSKKNKEVALAMFKASSKWQVSDIVWDLK